MSGKRYIRLLSNLVTQQVPHMLHSVLCPPRSTNTSPHAHGTHEQL